MQFLQFLLQLFLLYRYVQYGVGTTRNSYYILILFLELYNASTVHSTHQAQTQLIGRQQIESRVTSDKRQVIIKKDKRYLYYLLDIFHIILLSLQHRLHEARQFYYVYICIMQQELLVEAKCYFNTTILKIGCSLQCYILQCFKVIYSRSYELLVELEQFLAEVVELSLLSKDD